MTKNLMYISFWNRGILYWLSLQNRVQLYCKKHVRWLCGCLSNVLLWYLSGFSWRIKIQRLEIFSEAIDDEPFGKRKTDFRIQQENFLTQAFSTHETNMLKHISDYYAVLEIQGTRTCTLIKHNLRKLRNCVFWIQHRWSEFPSYCSESAYNFRNLTSNCEIAFFLCKNFLDSKDCHDRRRRNVWFLLFHDVKV